MRNNEDSVKNVQINMATMPLCWGHLKVVISGSMGQLIGQGLATLISVVIPMVQLVSHPQLSAGMQGILGCISLIGIMIGAFVFGKLSDKYGYLLFFRLCPFLLVLSSGTAYFFHSLPVLLICLFIMGFSIGGEYSLDSDYISEIMPDKWKIFMVGVAKASSSVGNILVAVLCFFIVRTWHTATNWPELLFIITGLGGLTLATRIHFAQSPGWLMSKGKVKEAEKSVKYFLGNNVTMLVPETKTTSTDAPKDSFKTFLSKNIKQVIFTGVPWACEGLGVYGIGIFMPTLVMALGIGGLSDEASPLSHIVNSVEITIWLSVVMLVGFVIGLLIVRRFSHVKIQTYGFLFCAAGLLLLLVSYKFGWASWIAITGFMMFELFLNAGPHLITFILPSQIYPVADRGTGNGIAASIGKSGAVIGTFFIPVIMRWGGCTLTLAVTIAIMVIGGLITAVLGNKIMGNDHKFVEK